MSSENFSWCDLLIISLKGRSTTWFYKGAVNHYNRETILAQFSKKWLCPCLCMHISISPFVELIDQFKLRLDKKAEISEITEVVVKLQLQLIVNYKFSKTRERVLDLMKEEGKLEHELIWFAVSEYLHVRGILNQKTLHKYSRTCYD